MSIYDDDLEHFRDYRGTIRNEIADLESENFRLSDAAALSESMDVTEDRLGQCRKEVIAFDRLISLVEKLCGRLRLN